MKILAAIAIGQLVGLLGWIDPLFVPLILVGPPVTGALAAARRVPLAPVVAMWASAGVSMIWTDYVVNQEDVVFHVVVTVVVSLLAAAGWGLASLLRKKTPVGAR